MGKWKLMTALLVVVSIILCMMTIYVQRSYNNMRISYNRADRDYAMLKNDYEKLYAAYYSYDKKILKILAGNEHVFWAKDSSCYVIKNKGGFLFSFYKKPRVEKPYFLLAEYSKGSSGPFLKLEYMNCGRVDTLKPHQYILANNVPENLKAFILSRELKRYEVNASPEIGRITIQPYRDNF